MRQRNYVVLLTIATIGLGIGIALISTIRNPALASMYRTSILTDIFETTPHKPAIDYLYQNSVVEGYPDQTFRPANTLNRAEFTTLIAKAKKIDLRKNNSSCFPDTPTDQWYHPYVCAAKERGWIAGYPDGTFQPGSKINKVEAIAILCRSQGWSTEKPSVAPFSDTPTNQWYTPCLTYAQSKNFLEETANTAFNPSLKITRGAFSEVLFRNLITIANEAETYRPDFLTATEKEVVAEKETVTEVIALPEPLEGEEEKIEVIVEEAIEGAVGDAHAFRTYNADFFDNIILREPLPNRFYKNEVYILEGDITQGSYTKTFAFLNVGGEHQNFIDNNVTNNHFKIPLVFKNTGNYELGLIRGTSGSSKLTEISVVETLPEPESSDETEAVSNISVMHTGKDDKTTLSWGLNGNNIVKITFTQDNISKTVFLRGNPSTYSLLYGDFADFKEGFITAEIKSARTSQQAPLRISSAWSTQANYSIKAAEHHKSAIKDDSITVNAFNKVQDTLANITLTGTVKTKTQREAAIITPNGLVKFVNIETPDGKSGDISKGTAFTLKYSPALQGRHIIEINNTEGGATFNVPFYVATGVPVIPNFFDLNKGELNKTAISLDADRQTLLQLINKDRGDHGRAPVALRDDLNALSQEHSDNMANQNFFGHYNPAGESPDDRRRRLNIQTGVGENLAKSPTLQFAQQGLMFSAIHRDNILREDWTQVGIGITKDAEGYLLVTQEFSTEPLDAQDIIELQANMLKAINEARAEENFAAVTIDPALVELAENWSESMVTEDFFGFETPTGVKLLDQIRALELPKSVQAFILEGSDIKQLNKELTTQTTILQEEWATANIGVSITNLGTIKITLLYTT